MDRLARLLREAFDCLTGEEGIMVDGTSGNVSILGTAAVAFQTTVNIHWCTHNVLLLPQPNYLSCYIADIPLLLQPFNDLSIGSASITNIFSQRLRLTKVFKQGGNDFS